MPDPDIFSETQRLKYIRALNHRTASLELDRVDECKKTIWESYEVATIQPQIATTAEEQNMEATGFQSIGIRSLVKLWQFNDPTYYWGPYFAQVGRTIAAGEQEYLQEYITQHIASDSETISFSAPDYSLLTRCIRHLIRNNLDPDAMLAPIDLFVSFVKHFDAQIDWMIHPEVLRIGDAKLKLFWSHKYAPLDNFIVFSSKAGTWRVKPDQDTGRSVTIALGESETHVGSVEYWVETLVRYSITNQSAFRIIGVSGRPPATEP